MSLAAQLQAGEQRQSRLRDRKLGFVSKIITSPSNRWPGTVEITDNPSWEQIDALEASFNIPIEEGKAVYFSVIDRQQIPAILAWVEKWDLQNFPNPVTVENFPRIPSKARHQLVNWIYDEIRQIYLGDVPNE